MFGQLDEEDRALLTVIVAGDPLDFVVDTGFGGTLVIGEELINDRFPRPEGVVTSELAAGQSYDYSLLFTEMEWFDEAARVEVLVGPGTECLLGTVLLSPHRLVIDYTARTVELIRAADWS